MNGYIHSFESFGTVDGPGIRFIVFMQGCPLRCRYCHNPDTWGKGGKPYTPEEVCQEVLKYKSYFSNGGGVTISGGEPLVQIDFVIELLTLLKAKGINTALDTSGCLFDKNNPALLEKYKKLISVTDLVLLDIKHIDSKQHEFITGRGNENTLAFAEFLSDNGIAMWIRHVLTTSLTDNDESLKKLKNYIDTLKTVQKVEVLPYHTMGVVKYEKLDYDYPLKGEEPPSRERVLNAKRILGIIKE